MADSPGIRAIRNTAVRESLALWTSVEQDARQAEAWLAPMVRRGTALVAVAPDGGCAGALPSAARTRSARAPPRRNRR